MFMTLVGALEQVKEIEEIKIKSGKQTKLKRKLIRIDFAFC